MHPGLALDEQYEVSVVRSHDRKLQPMPLDVHSDRPTVTLVEIVEQAHQSLATVAKIGELLILVGQYLGLAENPPEGIRLQNDSSHPSPFLESGSAVFAARAIFAVVLLDPYADIPAFVDACLADLALVPRRRKTQKSVKHIG